MKELLKKVYVASPVYIKKVLAELEAKRRNYYRQGSEYNNYLRTICVDDLLNNFDQEAQIEKLNQLLLYVHRNIPFYQNATVRPQINKISDMEKLPLLQKSDLMCNLDKLINRHEKLWQSKTSGSTGTPLKFYRDPLSMQYEYALYDKIYDYFAGKEQYIKARISGVYICSADCVKPPFWFYINEFNQLQCSAYHINKNNFNQYLEAFDKYKVILGTGYAKSWLFLAQEMLKQDQHFHNLKVIISDSEGLSATEKEQIKEAFHCDIYQTYGLSEVGMIALECQNNNYHILTDRSIVEIIDHDGNCLKQGELGEVVITDLYSFNAPFVRYKTGDLAALCNDDCGCGWKKPYLKDLSGRIDDFIITPEGKKIGRLGYIAKAAVGILGMQIVQTAYDRIEINVVPADNFKEDSMNQVLAIAKDYLGLQIKLTWKVVNKLEKNHAGKVKFVIRSIDS